MSKQLPYYQFEPAEYLAGDISICSLEAQGLYSVIKCLYWQKDCNLNVRQVLRRFDRMDLIEELTDEGAIKVNEDGDIYISFLATQYEALIERKRKLSEAGKKGGSNKKQASLKPPLNEDKATPKHLEEKRREEKRKEENKREEEKALIVSEQVPPTQTPKTIEERKHNFGELLANASLNAEFCNVDQEEKIEFFEYWTERGATDKKMRFEKQKSFDVSRRLRTWIKNSKKFNEQNGTSNGAGSIMDFINS